SSRAFDARLKIKSRRKNESGSDATSSTDASSGFARIDEAPPSCIRARTASRVTPVRTHDQKARSELAQRRFASSEASPVAVPATPNSRCSRASAPRRAIRKSHGDWQAKAKWSCLSLYRLANEARKVAVRSLCLDRPVMETRNRDPCHREAVSGRFVSPWSNNDPIPAMTLRPHCSVHQSTKTQRRTPAHKIPSIRHQKSGC